MMYAMCPNCGRRLCKGEAGTKVEIVSKMWRSGSGVYKGRRFTNKSQAFWSRKFIKKASIKTKYKGLIMPLHASANVCRG